MDESAPERDDEPGEVPFPPATAGQEAPSGADGTFIALEQEYDRLRADLKNLSIEIKKISGLRVEGLAKSIRQRRFRLLALEKKIFERKQGNLFPDLNPKPKIRRRKTNPALETSGKEALLEGSNGAEKH